MNLVTECHSINSCFLHPSAPVYASPVSIRRLERLSDSEYVVNCPRGILECVLAPAERSSGLIKSVQTRVHSVQRLWLGRVDRSIFKSLVQRYSIPQNHLRTFRRKATQNFVVDPTEELCTPCVVGSTLYRRALGSRFWISSHTSDRPAVTASSASRVISMHRTTLVPATTVAERSWRLITASSPIMSPSPTRLLRRPSI